MLLASLAVSGVSLAKADMKIAVVDIQTVIDSTKDGKKAKESLNKETADRQTLFETKKNEFKKAEEEFTKKQSVLTPAVRDEKQKELQNMYLEIQKMGLESEKMLKQKYVSLSQDIVKKIQSVITKAAVDKGYDLVLEKNQTPYFNSAYEITQDIVKLYDQTYK
jgi:outer membrane protein